jgi:phage N-6-adenine-methyltransferase
MLESHKYAELFPLIQNADFEEFKIDIAENGLREPIWLYEGKILDGRNRYRACLETNTELKTREYEGHDPIGFVLSLNLKRRHLDTAQRAMVASRLATLDRGNPNFGSANTAIAAIAQPEAAKLLNVSEDSIQRARKVLDQGTHDLIQKVDSGELAVSTAAKIAELPEEEQVEIIALGKEEIKKHVLAMKHTGDEESYTPPAYIESAVEVMGKIDLDPASNEMAQLTVNADHFYTAESDGLTKEWRGKVWMNPPYTARVINVFISKLVSHYAAGEVTEAIVLTNNNTDTSWFHEAANNAAAVCFTSGRINFLKRDGSKSSPTNGQSFIYFGKNIDLFKTVFSKHGLVMVKA